MYNQNFFLVLADLSNKNVVLVKEKNDAWKQRHEIYEEEDKKAEVQYSEYVNFYKENVQQQAQEIQKLPEKLDSYKKSTNSDKRIEIQCELPQESKEVAGLKHEIQNLKEKQRPERRQSE